MNQEYKLPQNIDRYLASLASLYAHDGKRDLQELIVNCQPRIHEAWTSDNWNGGTYGHALYLAIPEPLFLKVARQKDTVQKQIQSDINQVHNVQNEFIAEVFLEMEAPVESDWRSRSGLLLVGKRNVPDDAVKRIWRGQGFRVFLSHKSGLKKETAELKAHLEPFGITCFVAHVDIRPTEEWQDEIENALASMDAFIALMTETFHESDWTDQEVGFAFARRVPIIAVRLGRDPYGFIGKFQGLSATWQTAHEGIVKILIKNDGMFGAYIESLKKCSSWEAGNTRGKALQFIESASQDQIDALISAYNETMELRGSFAFNGSYPRNYGPGLVSHLNRLGNRKFSFNASGFIEERVE